MGTTIIQHLRGYRFPAADGGDGDGGAGDALGASDDETASAADGVDGEAVDRYLLVGEYTESNSFNPDGTHVRGRMAVGHGTREEVNASVEKLIDAGVYRYRSRKHGDDYFRAGVENALDDAETVSEGEAVDELTAVVGHGTKSDAEVPEEAGEAAREAVETALSASAWAVSETDAGIVGRAPVSRAVLDGIARVEATMEGITHAYRRFEDDDR